jgi:fluoride exporter
VPRLAELDRRELAAIFAGGALGALARAEITQLFPSGAASWPWAVFAINISGAFVLGYFVTQLQERLPLSSYRRPFIGTGFCGAFTTFSTMQLELFKMVISHHYGLAAAYAGASIVFGYLAVFTATALVRRIRVIR